MRKTIFASIGAAAIMLGAGTANARDFKGYTSTEPLLYLYAACVFEKNDGTSEDQIARCAAVKETALETVPQIIALFHVRNRSGVQREFEKGLDEIERDAEQIRLKSKPVPASIVKYLRCMGQNVIAQPEYMSGDAVSYIGIEDQCAAISVIAAEETVSDREFDTIDALYRRFQRFGRLTYPVSSSSQALRTPRGFRGPESQRRSFNRLPPVRRYDRSFLNLSVIKKVKPADEQQ